MCFNERILSYLESERSVHDAKVHIVKNQRCERLLARRLHEVRPVNCTGSSKRWTGFETAIT